MAIYYLNKNAQANGDHEVHQAGCQFMPDEQNQICLGNFTACYAAVAAAKAYYNQVNGCYYCANACHTQ